MGMNREILPRPGGEGGDASPGAVPIHRFLTELRSGPSPGIAAGWRDAGRK